MGKAIKFFDFMTVFTIFIVSMAVSAVISSGSNSNKGSSVMTVVVIAVIIGIFYSFSIMILGVRKSNKFSHGLVIVLGSVFVPVILPVIYYLTYLRELMGLPTAKEQFQQLVQTIQKNPESFQQLSS